MNVQEESSIKEAIAFIFDWIKDRNPGNVVLDWSIVNPPPSVVLDVALPSISLTPEENEFLPSETSLFSRDGTPPKTLGSLNQISVHLNQIGGHLALRRLKEAGMVIELSVPTKADEEDIRSKVRFITDEITNRFKPGDQNEGPV